MAISKITNPSGGFPHKALKVLLKKCRVFIARGEFSETDKPVSKTDLEDLYTGVSAKFIPFGDMDAGGSNVTWTSESVDIDFGNIPTGVDVTCNIVSITISEDSLEFASSMGTDQYSLLFVPDGDDSTFFAVSGMLWTSEGGLNIVEQNQTSKITYRGTRKANSINDVVFYRVFGN